MRVKSCVASDGGGHVIKLSDEYGCVLRPKMISRFLKARAPDEKATVITYAFFHAFKFPDALSVHIKCKVEICRHGCLDHCQQAGSNERKDTIEPSHHSPPAHENNELGVHQQPDEDVSNEVDREEGGEDVFYDDIIHNGDDVASIGGIGAKNMEMLKHNTKMDAQQEQMGEEEEEEHEEHHHHVHREPEHQMLREPEHQMHQEPEHQMHQEPDHHMHHEPEVHEDNDDILPDHPPMHEMLRKTYLELKKVQDDKFPHGPRNLEAKEHKNMPPVAGPRSLNLGEEIKIVKSNPDANETASPRRRRSIVVSDRKARSADVGVSGIYDVISEADLAFSPDTKQEAVTVFQGKISEEVVYGICMPVPGFSILFIIVTSAAVISALVAGSLLYRYQLQKVAFEAQQQTAADVAAVTGQGDFNPNTLASWMSLRLFRMGPHCEHHANGTRQK